MPKLKMKLDKKQGVVLIVHEGNRRAETEHRVRKEQQRQGKYTLRNTREIPH